MSDMVTASYPVEQVEYFRAQLAAGKIDQAQAIAAVLDVLDVTPKGALDLLTHPESPRQRYAAGRALRVRADREGWPA